MNRRQDFQTKLLVKSDQSDTMKRWTRPFQTVGRYLIQTHFAGLTATIFLFCFLNVGTVVGDEDFIPGPQAMKRLYSLRGQHVRVVLVKQNGDQKVFHARIKPDLTREDRISLDQSVDRRPRAENTLIEEYVKDVLKQSIDNKQGQELVKKLEWSADTFRLRLSGQTVESWGEQYLVQSIEPLDIKGPEILSRVVVSSNTVAENDPWVGDRAGQNSNREIVYQLKDSSKVYRTKLAWKEHPSSFEISSVEISKPGFFYYSRSKYEQGIEILVTYTNRRTGKHRFTYRGIIELDDEGYPTGGHFARAPFLDEAFLTEVAQAKDSSVSNEAVESIQIPSEMRLPTGEKESRVQGSVERNQDKQASQQKIDPADLPPLTKQQVAFARADIRGYVRDIRKKLLFNDSVPEYLKPATEGNFTFLLTGAARGWPEGQVVVALCKFYGIQCDQNQAEALTDLMPLVKKQDANAMLAVAWMELENARVPDVSSDSNLAITLLDQLAEWDDPVGLTLLAQCYQYGDRGVPQNMEKAFELWEKAAAQEAPMGLYMMGVLADTRGKHLEASRFFQKSAVMEFPLAEFAFGERHYFGNGWGQDFEVAFSWYKSAASSGLVQAQLRVADCYEQGIGVPRDWNQAYVWRLVAMKQGSLQARRMAAIAELDHAMSHFLSAEPEREEAALQRALSHFEKLQNDSSSEAQIEFAKLEEEFKQVLAKSIAFVEDNETIPTPIPKPSDEELEDMQLREAIAYHSLMSDQLEIQHSIYDGLPGARAVRMAEQDQELKELRDRLRVWPPKARTIPKLDRRAAAKRFAELWVQPLAKAVYDEDSSEFGDIQSRCQAALRN